MNGWQRQISALTILLFFSMKTEAKLFFNRCRSAPLPNRHRRNRVCCRYMAQKFNFGIYGSTQEKRRYLKNMLLVGTMM